MKKRYLLGVLGIAVAGFLASCGTNTSSVTNTKNTDSIVVTDEDTTNAATEDATFTFLNATEGAEENQGFTYDSSTGVISITQSGDYTLTGDLVGYIECAETLTSKVTITLEEATITSDTYCIKWNSTSSKVVVKAKKGTVNTLTTKTSSTNTDSTIESKNNVELAGKGTLNIINNQKHAVKADKILVESEIICNVNAYVKDGFHARIIEIYNGTFTIAAADDAIQAEYKTDTTEDGTISIYGGSITIKNSATGINADASIDFSNYTGTDYTVADAITVTVTNTETPMEALSITCPYTATLTYTVDGTAASIPTTA